MKRIGIITIQKVDNYGAELQAYALFYGLKQKEYDVEIIDYLYVKHPNHIAEKISKPYAVFPKSQWIKWKIIRFLYLFFPLFRNRQYKLRMFRFKKFYDEIKFSRTYRSYSELYNEKFDYDVFIVGSDQVWNPSTMSSLDPFFLTFAPKDSIKISYASSFGVSKIDENLKDKYKLGINNLTNVSCRESTGIQLIKELTGKNASLVLDPTLLLTKFDWIKMAKPYNDEIKSNKYILIYTVNNDKEIIKFAQRLKNETGWVIYQIRTRHISKKNKNVDLNIFDAGPSEFVDLILNAEFVLTNSFHGSIFPILLERPFYTILSHESKNNSRQEGLLKLLSLENRLLYENDNLDKIELKLEINFKNTIEKLDEARKLSWIYLESSIS